MILTHYKILITGSNTYISAFTKFSFLNNVIVSQLYVKIGGNVGILLRKCCSNTISKLLLTIRTSVCVSMNNQIHRDCYEYK